MEGQFLALASPFTDNSQRCQQPGGTLFLEKTSHQSSASSAKEQEHLWVNQAPSQTPLGLQIPSPELLLFNRQRLLWHLYITCS